MTTLLNGLISGSPTQDEDEDEVENELRPLVPCKLF